jgi:hypothetical protein
MMMKRRDMLHNHIVQTAIRTGAALLLALAMAAPALAQSPVSQSDIQRLQDELFQASSEVSRMRSTSQGQATTLQTELDDLRDEVVYLRVKLRKEGGVTRSEYADVRDRVQNLRSRARGERDEYDQTRQAPSRPPAGTVYDDRRPTQSSQGQATSSSSAIPVGQQLDVRLQSELYSDTAQPEDRFEATTVVDLYRGNEVLIPAGSVMRGVVSSVNRASRTDRRGSLTVAFDQITVRGRNYPMRGTVVEAIQSEGIRGEAGRAGAGAGVGAVIGGILGGVRGALLGILIGGGGTIAATEGTDVKLPAGTVLSVRLDTPPDINR